jgi:DNA-binding IclR family transcriptional regulator
MSTSVVRAARILDRLAHSQAPMTLAEIASELGIPKSTAFTILRDLASESFVTVSSPPAYWIGLKAFEVGSAHLRASGTAGAVAPELARLTRALNITSHYAVLDGTEVLYLCKEDPPTLGIQLASAVGARLPSHLTAVGKACLAWLEADCLPGHVELATSGARADDLPARPHRRTRPDPRARLRRRRRRRRRRHPVRRRTRVRPHRAQRRHRREPRARLRSLPRPGRRGRQDGRRQRNHRARREHTTPRCPCAQRPRRSNDRDPPIVSAYPANAAVQVASPLTGPALERFPPWIASPDDFRARALPAPPPDG